MKKTILATLATLTLIGCGGGTGSSGTEYTPYPDAPAISQSQKQAYLDAVNEGRRSGKQCGDTWYPPVPDLVWNDDLYKAAAEHARDVIEADWFYHDGSGTSSDWTAQVLNLGRGSKFWERMRNNGYDWSYGTENIAAGYQTLAESMNGNDGKSGLWASPHHCANFMKSQLKDLGAAYDAGDSFRLGTIVVFDMGVKQSR